MANDWLWKRLEAHRVACERQPALVLEYQLRLSSSANGSRGTTRGALAGAAKVKRAHRDVGFVMGRKMRGLLLPGSWFAVVLTRIAPRSLDDDNLGAAWKAVRDGVAKGLGIDDGDLRVRYVYDQQTGAPRESMIRVSLVYGGVW